MSYFFDAIHFPHSGPPYVREAAAHFVRKGKHYLITSGTTGYFPNPLEAAVADTWHGPYTVLGNPHPNDKSMTSYHSQISSVLKVEGKEDLFIAIADRWLPEAMDKKYKVYEKMFLSQFQPERGISFDERLMGDEVIEDIKKIMSLDINTKKLKKNAFRVSKVRGIGASRIRVPGGFLKAEILGQIQEIAEKYGNGIVHLTTRQGFDEYKKWAMDGVELLPETIVNERLYWEGIHYDNIK